MSQRVSQSKERKKSVILSPTETSGASDGTPGGVETEVAAQITIPPEGKWQYVVLVCSFLCQAIYDGCLLSYGAIMNDIMKSLNIAQSSAALVNAVEIAIIFIVSPFCSALINRFGFRTITMAGAMVAGLGHFTAYFCSNFISLLIVQGIVSALGVSMLSLASLLVVGFYFEKYRSVALAAATCGSSAGCMAMYPVTDILTKRSGWKTIMLLQASMHGFVFFLSLTFRPLVSVTVTQTEEEGNPTRTVTYLPTVSNQPGQGSDGGQKPNAAEKMLRAVSNKNFPTASAFFNPGEIKAGQQADKNAPSTSAKPTTVSKITLGTKGAVSKKQLEQMENIVSRMQVKDNTAGARTEVTVEAQADTHKSWFGRLFNWRSESPEARPMYRDDIFYQGKVEALPAYKKSVHAIPEKSRTGLEYQLAVSRAVSVHDLKEQHGVCTVALRRILASMMDPSLLKRVSFLMFCFSGFFLYLGVLVPYIYLQDRNIQGGVDKTHCSIFISVLAFSNLCGRLILAIIATKVEAAYLYAVGLMISGVSTIASDISYTVPYQYGYVVIYGLFVAVVHGVRSIVLVNIYGLENLTNATGLVLLFIGIGMAISTPLAGAIKEKFGYRISFYVAGGFITLAGVFVLPVKQLSVCEDRRAAKKLAQTTELKK